MKSNLKPASRGSTSLAADAAGLDERILEALRRCEALAGRDLVAEVDAPAAEVMSRSIALYMNGSIGIDLSRRFCTRGVPR